MSFNSWNNEEFSLEKLSLFNNFIKDNLVENEVTGGIIYWL